ncbi:MAG TPA: hypothetical protein VNT02_05145 [Burkholderiales bacterium]|nr:hypothetical protein [Burkholderiales bacterium]
MFRWVESRDKANEVLQHLSLLIAPPAGIVAIVHYTHIAPGLPAVVVCVTASTVLTRVPGAMAMRIAGKLSAIPSLNAAPPMLAPARSS